MCVAVQAPLLIYCRLTAGHSNELEFCEALALRMLAPAALSRVALPPLAVSKASAGRYFGAETGAPRKMPEGGAQLG